MGCPASCAVPCDSVSGRYCLRRLEKIGGWGQPESPTGEVGLQGIRPSGGHDVAPRLLVGFVTWSEN